MNKNLFFHFKKNIKNKNILYKINKKNNSNIVTLRAPKHFKVGRNHYHIIKKSYFLKFINFKINMNIPKIFLYKFLIFFFKNIIKKKITQLLSLLIKITITIKIKSSFVLI